MPCTDLSTQPDRWGKARLVSPNFDTWFQRMMTGWLIWWNISLNVYLVGGWLFPIYQWMIWMVYSGKYHYCKIWMMTGKYWLVVYLDPIWKIWVRWDYITFPPKKWKNNPHVPNHQPVQYHRHCCANRLSPRTILSSSHCPVLSGFRVNEDSFLSFL